MLPLVKDGPIIPQGLLEALGDERLVFLCGAGVSAYCGLPNFENLALGVESELMRPEDRTAEQNSAVKNHKWDHFFGLLESQYTSRSVRRHIAKKLLVKPKVELDFHKAILDLSRTRNRGVRLVTTNFDRRFHESSNLNFESHSSPLLPVPTKNQWNSLVFLHGLLDESIESPQQNLIFTDADFGTAYLTEGWGTRFVTRLFREFNVVFVGYSLSDPIMTYLVSALAAERKSGGPCKEAYSFVSYDSLKNEANSKRSEWLAKGVQPILYDDQNGHKLLRETFKAWASLKAGGRLSRNEIIRKSSAQKPEGEDDFATRQLLWVLQDETGDGAREFANIEPPPALEWWLDAIDKIPCSSAVTGHAATTISNLPITFSKSKDNSLVPTKSAIVGNSECLTINPINKELCRWLAKHSLDPRLLSWCLSKGSVPCAALRYAVRGFLDNLQKDNLTEEQKALISAWDLYISGLSSANSTILQQATSGDSQLNALTFVRECEPQISFKRGTEFYDATNILHYIDLEIHIRSGHNHFDFASQQPAILQRTLEGVTTNLQSAMDLFALVGKADQNYDPSVLTRLSISDHEQNIDSLDWSVLITHARDLHRFLVSTDSEKAGQIFSRWKKSPYPVFKRLALNAITENSSLSADSALEILLKDETLWSYSSQREVSRFLRKAGHRLTRSGLRTLENELLSHYEKHTEEENIQSNKTEVYHRFAKLRESGAKLSKRMNGILESAPSDLSKFLPENHSDEFVMWSEACIRFDDGESDEFINTAASDQEIACGIETDFHKFRATWRHIVSNEIERAINILKLLEEKSSWPRNFGYLTFRGIKQDQTQKEAGIVWNHISTYLLQTNVEFLTNFCIDLVRWFKDELRQNRNIILREDGLRLWDRLLPYARDAAEISVLGTAIGDAINHPMGIMTEILLLLNSCDNTKDLQPVIEERMTKCISRTAKNSSYAFSITTHYTYKLHRLSSVWTERNVLPEFSWDKARAAVAWQCYLFNPRLDANLFEKIKASFVLVPAHRQEIGQEAAESWARVFGQLLCDHKELFGKSQLLLIAKSLTDELLAEISQEIGDYLAVAEEPSAKWTENISSNLELLWPKEVERRTPDSSYSLVSILISTNQAFQTAFNQFKDFLVPIPDCAVLLHKISKTDLCKFATSSCFELLKTIIPESITQETRGTLRRLLAQIAEEQPDIKLDTDWTRLSDLASYA